MPDYVNRELKNIDLSIISKLIPQNVGIRLGEDFFLADVSGGKNLGFMNYPFRPDAYFAIFCLEGGVDVEVNLVSYHLGRDTLLISLPGNILRVVTKLSTETVNGRFIVLAFSKGFMSDLNMDMRKATDGHFFFVETPCLILGDEEKDILSKYLVLMKDIMDRDISSKRGALGALFSSLFYVLSGMFEKNGVSKKDTLSSSEIRVKALFDRFLRLVSEYHTSERGMAFYANKLGLTPKYLSKLVKQFSGRSGPDWIDSFVILEAKNMLRYSGDSIKEIVYKLNFLNPSVFYKYFKAHTGMTPSEYRNEEPA